MICVGAQTVVDQTRGTNPESTLWLRFTVWRVRKSICGGLGFRVGQGAYFFGLLQSQVGIGLDPCIAQQVLVLNQHLALRLPLL